MVVTLTSMKGGSGKSALATNLAGFWAQGERVLLIDLDPMAEASAGLGFMDSGQALANALTGRSSLKDVIRRSDSGVDVAVAGEGIGHLIDSVDSDAVRRAVGSVSELRYEKVVIDCPPGLTQLTVAAWQASPNAAALVPIDGPAGLRAAGRLRAAWVEIGLDARRLRAVLTRYQSRRVLDREVARQTSALFGPQLQAIRVRESVVVRESSAWGHPLVIHAPTHPVTDDIRRLGLEVCNGR